MGTERKAGRICGLALALVSGALMLQFSAGPAVAQEVRERRTLLQLLFGGNNNRQIQREPFPEAPVRQAPKRRAAPAASAPAAAATRPAAPRPAAPPAPPPVEKLENARKVLVVGDFMAGGVGDELSNAFAESPGVVIETRSNVASGLVRADYYDWQSTLPALIEEVKPAIVVVMIGANDRQQMSIGDVREKFRTEDWFKEYTTRVEKFGTAVTSRQLPLLWVGLPAFQSPSFTTDVIAFNRIYKAQAEKVGGEFVDIWDGFVDEGGKFIITGSDINGQQVRLRGSDGINFTKAGKRKAAFYVEKLLRRHLGDMASPALTELDSTSLPELVNLPPSEVKAIIQTQPIRLSDPELDGGSDLLGGDMPSVILIQSARDLLVKKGEMPPAPAGRVDDYRLIRTGPTP